MDDFDQHLDGELTLEEGKKFVIYDDKTGKPFRRGDTLLGNLSVGVGINLMIPFDDAELAFLEAHRIDRTRRQLQSFGWYAAQDEVRQVALADLVYNLGIDGLLNWPHFLSYMAVKDYANAALEIQKNEIWINQVHAARANRVRQMILTGRWPADVPFPSALWPAPSAST